MTGLASPMPSIMLEHEAQTLGLRESAFPPRGIGSQQQMQIAMFKRRGDSGTRNFKSRKTYQHEIHL
jgi:hypothetical protein